MSIESLGDEDDEIADVIAGCKDYMKELWEDPVVRALLDKRKSRLEDSPGL
jgi:guanine nucleotide-binding protein alpha-1 subunit